MAHPRPRLLSLLAALGLAACGRSDAPASPDPIAPPIDAGAQADVCGMVPVAAVEAMLGGSAGPPMPGGGNARVGTCRWNSGSAFVIVTARWDGIDRASFDALCASGTPPFPPVTLDFGVAACGRLDERGGSLWVQADATRAVVGVYASRGTLAQATDLLRAVAGRVP